jgi:acetyl-CoA carboxylase carboxyltransferase component
LNSLNQELALVKQGGDEEAKKKHVGRGKMLVRERINYFLGGDQSSFLELSPMAAHQVYDYPLPSAGIVTGIAKLSFSTTSGNSCTPHKHVMIVANDATVKGGTYHPLTVTKHLRAQEIARRLSLPCIYLVDSGGANLEWQAGVFPGRDNFGRIFWNQAGMSREGISQVRMML